MEFNKEIIPGLHQETLVEAHIFPLEFVCLIDFGMIQERLRRQSQKCSLFQVTTGDSGIYYCTASSSDGVSKTASVQIQVVMMVMLVVPLPLLPLLNHHGDQGDVPSSNCDDGTPLA